MTAKKKVSLIVPVYNAEKYLKQCMDSVINQTYSFLDIIMIDDGSTDGSGAICDFYAERDARIRVIHKKNQGLVSAWIDGTRMSTGDYLCYVDSDDWIDNNMVEEMLDRAGDNEREMICSNLWLEFDEKREERKNQLAAGIYEGEELRRLLEERILGNEQRTIMFSRCTKLIARELIEDNIKYCDRNIRMGEDLNIILPALLDCKRLVVMDKFYYHYRQSSNSMIHAYDSNLYEGICQLTRIIYHILEEKGVKSPEILTAKEYVFLMILVVKNELRGNRYYMDVLLRICRDDKIKKVLRNNKVKARNIVNQGLLLMMKHPNRLFFKLARQLILLKG